MNYARASSYYVGTHTLPYLQYSLHRENTVCLAFA
jgi:hypothetical protein